MQASVIRSRSLDCLRTLAIVLMVGYHFYFDLHHFGLYDTDPNASLGWRAFRYVIMSLFLACVGISMALSTQKGLNVKTYAKRTAWLFIACVLVSIGSYTQFPNSWIYFGILHFILFARIILLPLRHYPNIALGLALIILLGHNLQLLGTEPLFYALQPILNLPWQTEDLAPAIPWLTPVLIGLYIGQYRLHEIPQLDANAPAWVSRISKHSLLIYLIHQPILFGIIAGWLWVSA